MGDETVSTEVDLTPRKTVLYGIALLLSMLALPVSCFFIASGISHAAWNWSHGAKFATYEAEDFASFNRLCTTFVQVQRDRGVPVFEEWNAYCLQRNKEQLEKHDSWFF